MVRMALPVQRGGEPGKGSTNQGQSLESQRNLDIIGRGDIGPLPHLQVIAPFPHQQYQAHLEKMILLINDLR